ncbi:hypothetical protein M2137_001043 [Parabacteroides sp. PFB2-10]|uniref:DUF4837 family protein n=1 Tax=Parabacteroides sp. PFB2-10 TaxID=1742405 RepID=UPI00247479CE|nr:DUF4837 family protein [Parabacteroides sp. PFB2-10]MDH6312273.1 hypothetical protein [Parabacteroides sp. PFB2-10]
MKTMPIIFSLLFVLLLGACSSGPVLPNSTGLAYEVVVTMTEPLWQGEVGEAVKADLASQVPGLPQAENSLRITYASPQNFNGLLTYVRNLMILRVDETAYTQVSLNMERNRWSRGQLILTLNALTKEEAVSYLEANPKILVNQFVKEEMARAVSQFEKTYSMVVYEGVKNKFGAELKVPDNMTYFRDTADFFWASNNAGTSRMDVVVYSFPYRDENTFTKEYLVNKRDSIMKLYMPGSFPNSYMTTETRYVQPLYAPITLKGKYCGVLRGLWRMQGDMMGGPFVSHARLDEVNNRVVVVEGFVYAPETDKRNIIRRIEAALYTLRLPGEEELPNEVVIIP